MPMTNDIERLHGRIAELEARVAALEGVTDGWITWNGGDRPVDGKQLVECRFRGFDPETYTAEIFDWTHTEQPSQFDIIAYRVVK